MSDSAEVTVQAAEWTALLDSNEVTPEQRLAWNAWYCAQPQHRLIFDRMRNLVGQLDALDATQKQVLRRIADPPVRRPRRRHAVTGVLLAGACGWLLWQWPVSEPNVAEYRTVAGERREVTLSDHSRIVIDTNSALSAHMSNDHRALTLLRGQVFAEVAPDARRPFVVTTEDGTATALGTAFAVRRDEGGTVVTVVESRVKVCTASGDACAELVEGERVHVSSAGLSAIERASTGMPAWTEGWMEVHDQPVSAVLTELNRYLDKPVRFDARTLTAIHITGSYPLDRPRRALEAIAVTAGLTLAGENVVVQSR